MLRTKRTSITVTRVLNLLDACEHLRRKKLPRSFASWIVMLPEGKTLEKWMDHACDCASHNDCGERLGDELRDVIEKEKAHPLPKKAVSPLAYVQPQRPSLFRSSMLEEHRLPLIRNIHDKNELRLHPRSCNSEKTEASPPRPGLSSITFLSITAALLLRTACMGRLSSVISRFIGRLISISTGGEAGGEIKTAAQKSATS